MYNATITTQPYKSGKSLTIYVDNKNMVNELMIALMDAGFFVNYEPCYISENYEGCFLYDDKNVITICYKSQERTFESS